MQAQNTVQDVFVTGQKGRWSKHSSPVFTVKIVERERDELDDHFGSGVDQVKTLIAYHRNLKPN